MANDYSTQEMNEACPALDVTSSGPLTVYNAVTHEAFPRLVLDPNCGYKVRLEVNPAQVIEIHMTELQLLSLAGQIKRLTR